MPRLWGSVAGSAKINQPQKGPLSLHDTKKETNDSVLVINLVAKKLYRGVM
jgi:hypothetical protein